MHGSEKNTASKANAPVIQLHRIKRLETYEIMESDLKALDEATSRSEQNLAFFTACGGAFISCLITALTGTIESVSATATVWALTATLGLATAYFALMWWRERKRRPEIMERIRDRAREIR